MRTDFKLERWLCAIGLMAFAQACAGRLDQPELFRADGGGACDIPATLFASPMGCGRSGCHDATGTAAGLDLVTPLQGARLTGAAARGGGGLLIDPIAPDQSVLLLKTSPSPPFGGRMPMLSTPLDATTEACLRAWVRAQARAGNSDAGLGDLAGPRDAGTD